MCFRKIEKLNRLKSWVRKWQLFDFEQLSVEIFNMNFDYKKNDNEH